MVYLEKIRTMKKILGFAGSNSSKSINHALLQALSKEFNAEFELISLRDYAAPLYSPDLIEAEGVPQTIKDLHEKMKAADGLIVSAAEHNGSMAAVLKSTFDWLSMLEQKFFLDKPTVFISTSPGPRGAESSLKHLVEIMPYRGADIVGSLSVPSFFDNVKDGNISEDIKKELVALIRKLEQ